LCIRHPSVRDRHTRCICARNLVAADMAKTARARWIVICVAGMPRSGTSLVTQLLHRCGLNIGPPEQLMPASINNTDGYWENLRFVRLNERLLAASGGTWFAPPATLRPRSAM